MVRGSGIFSFRCVKLENVFNFKGRNCSILR